MNTTGQAFISGTTLAQFVSATYACSMGCKYVYGLYGLRQVARELTDRPEVSEKNDTIIVGAAPIDTKDAPPGLMKLGFLTMCDAPVHRLSYADTQRVMKAHTADPHGSNILFHFTKITGSDGIIRVFYSIFKCQDGDLEPLQPLKLSIDNLVDSLQGFTKISNVFSRSTFVGSAEDGLTAMPECSSGELGADTIQDIEILAREKAVLVKRIVELTNELNTLSMKL
ncbi:hypothetical protein ABL78_7978 [Leptomonas seymouri]|uniref:Uncharacterized protein n=1 Tax=Leptomonas seymouri TaxID=5684 RepID=A0A0N1HYT0_LEPSE|nr:hypothetical protein ABL78_7978 [Leptomonas seymouri]|eukprot:KPI83005.1 hypothetical protein ABL78_7978 [Leptomonas seymouri]